MLVCVDIDGTIDTFPNEISALMQSMRAAGHVVVVLTGQDSEELAPEDVQQKADYLTALGASESYDRLIVVPQPHPENKASVLRECGADMLIDNSKDNAKAAADICPVLVPWQSRR